MILLSSIGDSKALSESDGVGWDGNSANNMQMWHMRGSGRMVSRQWCSTRIWHAVCVQRASCLEQSGVLLMSNMGVRWRFWKSNEIDDQSASNDTLCTYVTSAGWWSVRWWSHIALGKVIPLWLWPRAYISVIVCVCVRACAYITSLARFRILSQETCKVRLNFAAYLSESFRNREAIKAIKDGSQAFATGLKSTALIRRPPLKVLNHFKSNQVPNRSTYIAGRGCSLSGLSSVQPAFRICDVPVPLRFLSTCLFCLAQLFEAAHTCLWQACPGAMIFTPVHIYNALTDAGRNVET